MGEEKISPVPEMQEKYNSMEREEKPENNLTISTKLSTEQLICKTPQESPNASVKSLKHEETGGKSADNDNEAYTWLLYMGTLQILFGLLMAAFGVLVIVHNARLAQLGGGLWGGCLAVASGTTGVLAAARNWCPLKSSAQRVAHTVFLALSLISVAVSQLVLVLAATGLARDINHTDFLDENEGISTTPKPEETFLNLPPNYLVLLSNAGLIIVSGIEFVCATVASYQSARALCPCFRDQDEMLQKRLQVDAKDAFVNSWLGKHTLPPPLYVMAAPTNTGKRSKLSNGLTVAPLLTLPPSVLSAPPVMRYPLIPAPLGPIPSPIIRPHPKEMLHRKQKRYHSSDHQVQRIVPLQERPRKSRSKSKEKPLTTEELVRTYTGLDRTIAEEFIEICDSRNTSMCSDSSCQSSCQSSGCNGSHSGCTACTSVSNTSSEDTSRDVKL